jgi:hypothetical protein
MTRRPLRFYCFSPPVMLATFIIEASLLIYALVRYKTSTLIRIIAMLLFFLSMFQLSEYHVCSGMDISTNSWSRIGFVAITILPPLGLHLLQVITGKGGRFIKWVAYFNALIWIAIFTFGSHTFAAHQCAGNYIIFQLSPSLDRYYYFYYFGWLLITMSMALYFAAITSSTVRRACLLLFIGYCIFLVPTTVVNTIDPATTAGIPSIMCGFAVLFAFILVFGILPITSATNKSAKKHSLDNK